MQDVFPNMPADVIAADLRITHSVEITIENIIEERVTAPPVSLYDTLQLDIIHVLDFDILVHAYIISFALFQTVIDAANNDASSQVHQVCLVS